MEQIGNSVTFYAHFVASQVGATGLTVTIDVYKTTQAGVTSQIVTGGSATEVGGGLYKYLLASGSVDAPGEYVAVFKTTGTADQKHIPALWVVGRGGDENLDATISSRNATTPPTAAAVADEVRVELATELALVDVAISSRAAPGAAMTLAANAVSAAALAADAGTEIAAAVVAASVSGAASGTVGGALGLLTSAQATIVANYDPATQALSYLYGDDYAAEDNRAQDFTTTLTLSGGSVTWRVKTNTGVIVIPCTLVDTHTYRLAPTAIQLATIGVGMWYYELEIVLASGHTVTEIRGTVTVVQDIR